MPTPSFQLLKWLYIHKCPFVCQSVCKTQKQLKSFILHKSTFNLHHFATFKLFSLLSKICLTFRTKSLESCQTKLTGEWRWCMIGEWTPPFVILMTGFHTPGQDGIHTNKLTKIWSGILFIAFNFESLNNILLIGLQYIHISVGVTEEISRFWINIFCAFFMFLLFCS